MPHIKRKWPETQSLGILAPEPVGESRPVLAWQAASKILWCRFAARFPAACYPLNRFDVETRSPLVAYDYTADARSAPARKRMPSSPGSFFHIGTPQAQVTAFKEAEDGHGFILRLRETAGQKGVARFESPVFPLLSAQLANGVEDNLSALPVSKNTVQIPLKPHGFSTVRLVFGRPSAPGLLGEKTTK